MKVKQRAEKHEERKFNWNIEDPNTQKKYRVEYLKSRHLEKRICQRNLNDELIQTVIDYGKVYFKQGLIFYVLGENNVPDHIPIQDQKRFKNMVVVASGTDACILTAYRSTNPFKHIKKKSKNLSTNRFESYIN